MWRGGGRTGGSLCYVPLFSRPASPPLSLSIFLSLSLTSILHCFKLANINDRFYLVLNESMKGSGEGRCVTGEFFGGAHAPATESWASNLIFEATWAGLSGSVWENLQFGPR